MDICHDFEGNSTKIIHKNLYTDNFLNDKLKCVGTKKDFRPINLEFVSKSIIYVNQ